MATELAQVDVEVEVEPDAAENVLIEGQTGTEIETGLPETSAAVETPGNGVDSVFPPFDTTQFASHLFWLAIAFGLLYFFVQRLVVPQVGGILEDRRDRIASDLGEAARLSRETDEVIAAYETELLEARQKAYAIAHERREEIKAEQARQQAETEEALTQRISEAETEIAKRRDAALADVDAIAIEAARAIVERLANVTISESEAEGAVASQSKSRTLVEA